jgi:hypothetical protein
MEDTADSAELITSELFTSAAEASRLCRDAGIEVFRVRAG